jgi:hypothetical protein
MDGFNKIVMPNEKLEVQTLVTIVIKRAPTNSNNVQQVYLTIARYFLKSSTNNLMLTHPFIVVPLIFTRFYTATQAPTFRLKLNLGTHWLYQAYAKRYEYIIKVEKK